MNRNLGWKFALIVVLAVVAFWTLYPPSRTIKPGIDLAGGTSLTYEIDPTGLADAERHGLSQRMIAVLQRRVDPHNVRNLLWRPQGATRFEVVMPLASAEAREKRENFEVAMDELMARNVNPAAVMRILDQPQQQRKESLERLAHGCEDTMSIFEELASIYDQRQQLRSQRDQYQAELDELADEVSEVGITIADVEDEVHGWSQLSEQELAETLRDYLDEDDAEKLELLTRYVEAYRGWAEAVDELTDPEEGLNIRYERARSELDDLNVTREQMIAVLETPNENEQRNALEQLKEQFPERAEQIRLVATTFEQYQPFRGRLDDPRDLQRMLEGAGILEFRIIPTRFEDVLRDEQIDTYVENLTQRGPRYASDESYVWLEIEDPEEWNVPGSITAPFGAREYVLTSNLDNEKMLQDGQQRQWQLERARPTSDQMGRRAIAFRLDQRGGATFGRITGDNLERQLGIMLDNRALSAPTIQSRITTEGTITGNFSQTEINDMIDKLNAGSLPARLIEQPISVRTVGPSIGAENRDQGITAVIVGFFLVAAFMIVYYLIAGVLANVALFLNVLFVLGFMVLLRATFTLPGIAGLILTIGMSVDANVLIFERIREEQKRGSSLRIAIKNGYERAFRTIFDANVTTFITAAILLWQAPEEVKGFAIVLMLGIVASMFTALFVTRVFFDWLTTRKILKDKLSMLAFFGKTSINWMAARKYFFTVSAILILAGIGAFLSRDEATNSKYGIEFTGGTSVEVTLREGAELARQDVADRIHAIGREINNPALAAAGVYSVGQTGDRYEITTTATNETVATITLPAEQQLAATQVRAQIAQAARQTGYQLSELNVRADNENTFTVSTGQMNTAIVREVLTQAFPQADVSDPYINQVVNEAVMQALGEYLELERNLQPEIANIERIDEEDIGAYPELADFLGGVRITTSLQIPATRSTIENRLRDIRFRDDDVEDMQWYEHRLLDENLRPLEADREYSEFVYISSSPEAGAQMPDDQWQQFAAAEEQKITQAMQLEASLPRVTQIDPSIGGEAKTQAVIAIFLSLLAIIGYIWVRFGSARYGLAAIAALVHDVTITLGALVACTYIAGTAIGDALLIRDFNIDLTIIAAFLTLIGYSLNDTIVVFDRIRENRKKKQLVPQTVSDSINETIPRTILTSLTTFLVVLVMYIFGGAELRGFTFAIGLGVIVGSYSSIAIAAPLLLIGAGKTANEKKPARTTVSSKPATAN